MDALRGLAWPEEFSFRVVHNKLTQRWSGHEREAATAFGSLAADYAAARLRQDFDVVAIVAGECVGIIHDRPAAASIVETMVAQAQSLLGDAASLDFCGRTSAPALSR